MLAKKVAYNTFAQIAGKILGFFISGVTLIIIAEHLGTFNLGNYVTIIAFVGFFSTLSDLGANLVMVRDIAQNEDDRVNITAEFLGFRITFSLIIMLLAPFIAMLVPQYGELIIKGTIIAAGVQFLLLINQLFVSMLQTQLMLDRGVFAEMLNRVVTLSLVVLAVRFNYQGIAFFYAVLYATLAGAAVNLLTTFAFARKLWPVKIKISLQAWQKTLITIAPIGLFTFLGMVHFKADTIILSLMKTPYDVGVYGYAYKIGEILFAFPTMFMGAVFPRLSQLLVTDKAKFYKFAQVSFDALLIGAIPFLTFVFLSAKYFTVLLSRNSFTDGLLAGNTLQILTFAMLSWFLATFFIHVLIMANDYNGLIRNLTIAVIFNIILNLILIPKFSYYGAAVTTGVTELLMIALTVRYTKQKLNFLPRLNYFFPIIIATLVMGLAILLITALPSSQLAIFAQESRTNQMALIAGLGLISGLVFTAVFYPFSGRKFISSFRSND